MGDRPDFLVENRFTFGAAIGIHDDKLFAAAGDHVLESISGKGIIYGGSVIAEDPDVNILDSIGLFVDGEEFAGMTLENLKKYNFTDPLTFPLHLMSYDLVNSIYNVAIRSGITFETDISLHYWAADAAAKHIFYFIHYALI